MRVFIPGVDGYLGWALAQYLVARGHEVAGCDLFLRRKWVEEIGSHSATPIRAMQERLAAFKENFGKELVFKEGDLRDYDFVLQFLNLFHPEAIVHLGEMPSAPYSMIGRLPPLLPSPRSMFMPGYTPPQMLKIRKPMPSLGMAARIPPL